MEATDGEGVSMPFTRMLALYAISLVVFLGIDFVWLASMGERFYRPQLGQFMERP